MSLAELTFKYIRPGRCECCFFLLKSLKLKTKYNVNIILILLTNMLLNELNNSINTNDPLALRLIELNTPNNTGNSRALKLNDSCHLQVTYNFRINWLENKLCRQINDSYHPIDNYNKDYAHCVGINWPKNKMCHHVDDSYQLPNKWLVNYSTDSYQLPEIYVINDKYLDDNHKIPDNYVHYMWIKWPKNTTTNVLTNDIIGHEIKKLSSLLNPTYLKTVQAMTVIIHAEKLEPITNIK